MVKCLHEFIFIFTVFLKNKKNISKIRRSKVTDYAALTLSLQAAIFVVDSLCKRYQDRHNVCPADLSSAIVSVTIIVRCSILIFRVSNGLDPDQNRRFAKVVSRRQKGKGQNASYRSSYHAIINH